MTGRLWLLDYYGVVMRRAVQEQLQYRASNYFYMIGMIAEPVVYLVVWSTVARSQGGSVGGISEGGFAAYYIVWTLVRNMNIVLTPFAWEERIREGQLSGELMRPVHPIHYDIAYFAGWKVAVIILWLPLAGVLSLLFRPELHVTPAECVAFFLAIWGAYLIRTMALWLLGMITFWTTRVSALYQMWFTAELLLSGRLVPLALLPGWVAAIGAWTPFPSMFGVPIDMLVADLSGRELVQRLLVQAAWIGIGVAGVMLVWRFALRRYTAVGN